MFAAVRIENPVVLFELFIVILKIVIEKHNTARIACIAAIFFIFFLMSGVSSIKQTTV